MPKNHAPRIPEEHRRAMEANETCERIIEHFTSTTAKVRQSPVLADLLRRTLLNHRIEYDAKTLTPSELMVMDHGTLGHLAMFELWKREGRAAYDLNEYMAAELYQAKVSKLPGYIFERVRHISPLVILPDPWLTSHEAFGKNGLIRGFFIFGHSKTEVYTTVDPRREGIGVMYFVDVLDEETGEIAYSTEMSIPLPTFRDKFTVEEAAKYAASRFDNGIFSGHRISRQMEDLIAEVLHPTLSILVYLTVNNLDVVEPRHLSRKQARKRRHGQRDPFYVKIGWKKGPALHATRQRLAGRSKDVSNPTGVEQGLQHRSGHMKVVHVGPGRKREETVWVDPYWTKLEMLAEGEDPPTTIIPVNEQRGDAGRKRGLNK